MLLKKPQTIEEALADDNTNGVPDGFEYGASPEKVEQMKQALASPMGIKAMKFFELWSHTKAADPEMIEARREVRRRLMLFSVVVDVIIVGAIIYYFVIK
jgi:hypothetical protein